MLWVAGALAVGIAVHHRLPVAPGWLVLWAVTLGLASMLARRGGVRLACVAAGLVVLGAGAAQVRHYSFADDDVSHYAGTTPRLARVEVTLPDPPRLLRVAEVGRPRPPRQVATAHVRRVQTYGGWASASGTMLVQFDRMCPDLRAGDRVQLFGWLERPGPAVNPGQFDFANFYRSRRTLASMRVNGPGAVTLVSRDGPRPTHVLRENARRWLLAGFGPGDADRASVLRAMLIGERDPAMDDARDAFRRSGTGHYLAISGLHVGIVGAVGFGVARLTGAGPRVSTLSAACVVGLFVAVAVPSAPVLRAGVLGVALSAGLLLGRRGNGLNLLGLAAAVILLVSPLDLFRAGFQLSFVTVLALMLLAGPAAAWLHRRGTATPSRANGVDPWPVRTARWVDGRLVTACVTAGVAWLASMPLVAWHFEQFNPWGVPASLAAAPWVALSLVAGLLKIVLTAALPAGAPVFAAVAGWPTGRMLGTVEFFAGLPGADVPLPPAPVWLVVGFYACLLATRIDWPWTSARLATWSAAVAAAGGILLVPFVVGRAPVSAEDDLRLTVLAVGAGQCVVVEPPGSDPVVIDAGSMSLTSPVERCVGPFLRHRGIVRLDRLTVSHAHADHYNAAADLVRRYRVREVLVPVGFDASVDAAGRTFLDELAHLDRPPRRLAAGDAIPLGRRTTLTVLYPPADADLSKFDPNDQSLVLRLEHDGLRILLPGDVQADAIDRLLIAAARDPDLLRADVLVAPHHGSSESNTPDLLDAVAPAYVIASDGRNQSRRQLDFDAMCRDIGPHLRLLRTHRDGAVTVWLGPGGVRVEAFDRSRQGVLAYPE